MSDTHKPDHGAASNENSTPTSGQNTANSPEPIVAPSTRQQLLHFVRTAKLPVALAGVVVISLLLTILSVWLYSSTGANRLDLSRPGFERERSEVRESEPRRTYDTSSPVTSQAIDEFLTEYDDRVNELNSYNGFSSQDPVSDEALKLNTGR